MHVDSVQVTFGLAKDGPERLVKRLVSDWRRDSGLKVEEIYDQEKRKAYAARIRAELDLEDGTTTSSSKKGKSAQAAKKSKGQGHGHAASRKGIVPRSFHVAFPSGSERVAAVLAEMKRLDTQKFPNASAVIFRTFFEISVLHYLKKHQLPANQSDTLKQVTERAITHLTANHPRPNDVKDAVKPVRAGFSVRDGLFGIQTFHDYVHSAKRHPLPTELRSQWDNFSDFLKLLWD